MLACRLMPLFLPFAVGGLALMTLGLGVKRALETSPAPPDAGTRDARALHRTRVAGLKAARLELRKRVRAYAATQDEVARAALRPSFALLERLARWELAPAPVLALLGRTRGLLASEPSRLQRWPQALLGAVEASPAALEPMFSWMDGGWLVLEQPFRLAGVDLFAAIARGGERRPGEPPPEPGALETASEELERARQHLEEMAKRVAELDVCVRAWGTRTAAHLAYLDPVSLESGAPEPLERLARLTELLEALVQSLRTPLLARDGTLLEDTRRKVE